MLAYYKSIPTEKITLEIIKPRELLKLFRIKIRIKKGEERK